jgi:Zn-dependent protease with chaperone function
MTAILLVGFAAALTLVVPSRLAGARWTYRSPSLGVLAWQATTHAVVVALVLAGVVSALHWESTHAAMCQAWQVCLDAFRGSHGGPAQVAAFLGVALLAALAYRLGAAWWQVAVTARRYRDDHQVALHLAGLPRADLEVTVVEHPDPAAYLVPGRQPRVVVTTGALGRLSKAELAAVLAHERAHAAGRHHRLRDAVRLLHRAFPRIPVFASADGQVTRLIEMCADDTATRQHSRLTLARALVAMATPQPDPALHAAGGDAAERLHRLLDPPPPLPRTTRALVLTAWTLVPIMPLAIVVLDRLAPAFLSLGL